MRFSGLKTRLNLSTLILLAVASVFVVFFVNFFQRQNALKTAEEKAAILLQHNLAIHSYINKQLKPKVFSLTDSHRDAGYFDPVWMSSTYAVRDIDKLYRRDTGAIYYYKEAAINARSPENEADGMEREFIQRLKEDRAISRSSGVRDLDGKPYFFTLIRGESMETGCLRCHSAPEQAPGGLVAAYGPTRSFNRTVDELVSVISIRIPLEQAYHEANILSAKLSAVLLLVLLAVFTLQNRLLGKLVLAPLQRLRSQAEALSGNPEDPGAAIPQIYTDEMNDIAGSFNRMSLRIKEVVDNLDSAVGRRTFELQESESRYHQLFENMINAFALYEVIPGTAGTPMDYRFLEVNPAFEKLSGRSAAEIVGKTLFDVMPDIELELLETYRAVAAGREPVAMEWHSGDFDRYFHVWCFMPRPGNLAAVFNDITDRRKAEESRVRLLEQLHQSQKLESVGRLAGGVAHDFNNKLMVILGNAEVAAMGPRDPEKLLGHLREITRAAEHSRNITAQLLAFSRQQVISPRLLDANQVIAAAQKSLSLLIGERLSFTFAPGEGLWPVKIDPVQLDQIVMNLAVNARDAMPEGGLFSIETANVALDEALSTTISDAVPGDYVRIVFSDTGGGMSAEVLGHIFEPFFTTKEQGKGTGLGLSTIYGIVRQNGGFIDVRSEAGRGSCFMVYLPRQEGHEAGSRSEAIPLPGSGSILLVEDEEPVRKLTSLFLQSLGYTVMEASGPIQALKLASDGSRTIDLLLTDVAMPEMKGPILFERISETRPGLKTIFMSGSSPEQIETTRNVHFLQKPCDLTKLSFVIKEVMGW